jgi:hypothetical protein
MTGKKATSKTKPAPILLATGQLWQINGAYIYIVELGKRLISYKMMRQPKQRAVRTQMAGIDALEAYLLDKGAKLVS